MYRITYFLLVFTIYDKCGFAAPTDQPQQLFSTKLNDRIKLCGSALSETLLLLCDGIYVTQSDGKYNLF